MTFKIFLRSTLMLACLGEMAAPTFAQKPVAPPPNTTQIPGLRYTAKGEVVVPLIFPMLGDCHWSDTWGCRARWRNS